MLKSLPFILSLYLLLNSCSYKQIKNEAPAINNVKVNEKFRINLPEDHRTGSSWQLNNDYNKSLLKNLNVVWHGNEKGIDFNFQALSVGEVTLSLIKRKYVDTIDYKTFIVSVKR
ncbi:MAG: hypothetical protein SFY56_16345 [Bacteroidota bacterium]|nr:hypothetical protein [Bacteroidota bacterium]